MQKCPRSFYTAEHGVHCRGEEETCSSPKGLRNGSFLPKLINVAVNGKRPGRGAMGKRVDLGCGWPRFHVHHVSPSYSPPTETLQQQTNSDTHLLSPSMHGPRITLTRRKKRPNCFYNEELKREAILVLDVILAGGREGRYRKEGEMGAKGPRSREHV
ncbi:hypothetical protein KM043_005705 [Ampulex compressa]|nr:hypothetical protein KM043_005705 [Ampulex compressa]